jgi:class 3 adenylate cyclase
VAPNWRPITERWLSFLLPSLSADRTRKFAAILFTDLVGSTSLSSSLGDDEWSSLLASHDRVCDTAVGAYRGRVVKRTGDGILATFDTASAAVRAAVALRSELTGIGLEVRAGVHAGEIDVHDDGDISGLAVNIAARVEAVGGGGDVLVTSTVRDMLLGSGLAAVDRGEHELKGIDGTWRLHAVP